MTRIVRVSVALQAVLAFAAASPLAGQHVGGAFVLDVHSDNPELPGPAGFGAFIHLDVGGGWLVRLSLQRISQQSRKEGVVCVVYSPRIGCAPESVVTNASVGGLRVGALRMFRVGGWLRVGAGGGVSLNALTASSRGVSGRRADLLLPRTAQTGLLALLSGEIDPVPGIPVRLVGTVSRHWMHFNGCSGIEGVYDPFCGYTTFREVELGVAYSF